MSLEQRCHGVKDDTKAGVISLGRGDATEGRGCHWWQRVSLRVGGITGERWCHWGQRYHWWQGVSLGKRVSLGEDGVTGTELWSSQFNFLVWCLVNKGHRVLPLQETAWLLPPQLPHCHRLKSRETISNNESFLPETAYARRFVRNEKSAVSVPLPPDLRAGEKPACQLLSCAPPHKR